MFSEKYKPQKLEGFAGNAAAEFIRTWDGRPLIIHGASGTGKTLLVELASTERGWEVVHIDDENIANARNIAATSSLFGARKLLVIDNVDKIRDIKAVGELIKETKSPLVMTTDNFKSKRLATIKRSCQDLQLRKHMTSSIAKHLAEICKTESIKASKEVLEAIAKNSGGDIRSALNDLETLAGGRKEITEKDLEVLAQRDSVSDIYRALSIIFGSKNLKEVVESTWDLEEEPRDVLWWIEENTPLLYKDNKAVAESFSYLSKADIFIGRIQSKQYWGFLRYASPLMTAGVNVSRPEKINFTRYQPPSYFISLGRAKRDKAVEKSISGKMAAGYHASSRVFAREYIPLLRTLIKNSRMNVLELKEQYHLEDEEIDYLDS